MALPGTVSAPEVNPTTAITSQNDAMAQIQSVLAQYGLTGLSSWAWQQLTSGMTSSQIEVAMHDQPTYKQRFPYEQAMRDAGLPVLSPAEMLANEAEYKRVQRSYGVTPSENPSDYVGLFANQVSPNEFDQRLQMFHKLRTTYSPYIRQQFEEQAGMPNISDSDLYGLLSGQDTTLAQRYAQATGTPVHTPSFADLQTAEQKAVGEQQALFGQGGKVDIQQPGTSPAEVASKQELAI